MSEMRIDNARRGIVAILERAAHREPEQLEAVEGIEDDLKSVQTLVARLGTDLISLPDIQEVFAHLLDHVICDVQDLGEEVKADQDELGEALDDYMDKVGSRLEAKIRVGARRCEALENVFRNYWDDQDEDEGEDEGEPEGEREEERSAGYAGDSEGGEPDTGGLLGRLGRFRPGARREPEPQNGRKPVRRPSFPRSGEFTGEVEVEE